jgi:ubiquinone/menaquinone biosynthesis C-methylase UbiE
MKLLCLFLALAGGAWPQAAGDVNARYRTREGRVQVAAGLANPDRDKTQMPESVVTALALKPGMTVADIGTGVGYLLPYLSNAVGPSGKVLAEDVQTDFLDQAKAKIQAAQLSNVSLILGEFTDPKLPPAGVDVELVLDVYHHFDEPAKMLAALAPALKPGGRLVIVEYHKADSPQPGHILREWSDVQREVEASGYRLLSKIDRITVNQYMLTFVRK